MTATSAQGVPSPPAGALRLGIDLDGVVADFTTGWVTAYNEAFGAGIDPASVRSWHSMVELTHFASMSEFWRWARFGDGPSLFHRLEPYPGAVGTLTALSRRHHVVIITTKPDWAVHDTYAWIARHRLPTREVHILDEKWRAGCDVYLEDRNRTLERLVEHRPEATVCRFVRPWNRQVPGTIDVATWDGFADVVANRPG